MGIAGAIYAKRVVGTRRVGDGVLFLVGVCFAMGLFRLFEVGWVVGCAFSPTIPLKTGRNQREANEEEQINKVQVLEHLKTSKKRACEKEQQREANNAKQI